MFKVNVQVELHSYIPAMNDWNLNFFLNTIYNSTKKIKYLGINLTKYV